MASFVSGGGGGSSVFVVEYGTTTYIELENAINSNKILAFSEDGEKETLNVVIDSLISDDYITLTTLFYNHQDDANDNILDYTYFCVTYTISNNDSWSFVEKPILDIYSAIYNTTTFSELDNAIRTNGKLPIIIQSGAVYIPSIFGRGSEAGVGNYEFECLESAYKIRKFKITENNVWSDEVIKDDRTKIWTGTCSTAANTSAKVVALDDATGFSLIDGVKIAVTFTNGQTNGSGTLNVNNTGAKDIAIMYSVTGTGSGARNDICWGQHETVFFTYSGTQWLFEGSGYLHSKTYNLASSALPKSGGTMTGALTLSGAPTSNLHAATKKYVDDTASTKVPKSYSTYGGSVGVDLTSSHKTKSNTGTGYFKIYTFDENNSTNTFEIDSTSTTIHKVVTPTEDGDAVNKKYVDDSVASIDALPSQSGNSGKFLTTNGTAASWANAPEEIFVATYGTTTQNELVTAYNAGKTLFCKVVESDVTRILPLFQAFPNDGAFNFIYVTILGISQRLMSSSGEWSTTGNAFVPTTRTVNSKALSSDITLTASDVGALPSTTAIPKVYYGTCSTSASTAAKVVTCSGFVLEDGATINVNFNNANSADSPTLNVNSTGAKSIKKDGTYAMPKYGWLAGQTVTFTFVGDASIGYWTVVGVNTYVTAGQKSGTTIGTCATAEGLNTTASYTYAHAEGYGTTASAQATHAEGWTTTASTSYAHAEGYGTTASGTKSHAEGDGTTASADSAHAEGSSTNATEAYAHAEGVNTTAEGLAAHAEGQNTTATGDYSHAEGDSTIAETLSQHVFGEYNVADTAGSASARGDYVEIVGNGTADNARSNARTLDWSGNEVLAGSLTVGSAPTSSNVARNITISTSEPTSSDGANGDIWFVYEE